MRGKHPAKFSQSILQVLDDNVPKTGRYLDPFAGTGKVYQLERGFSHQANRQIVGVEIEPEWATLDPRTVVGDALALPFASGSFNGVITSPTYGNRFADHHKAQDASTRRSYTHDLGRDLHPHNSGSLHWGEPYREFHGAAWREVGRVIEDEGLFVLNVKDHVRKKQIQLVSDWHRDFIVDELGFQLKKAIPISVTGLRYGENHEARVDHEWVFLFQKGT